MICFDTNKLRFNYRSYEDVIKLLSQYQSKLYGKYDLVVGVPRSGVFPASIIALCLNLPYQSIGGYCTNTKITGGNRFKNSMNGKSSLKVLVIDDSINTGTELNRIKEEIKKSEYSKKNEHDYMVVFTTAASKSMVDYYCEIVEQKRVFQWNIHNSWLLENACVDLDGVLCRDPLDHENDDGENYLKFISQVPLIYHPVKKIKSIVTSRLEKYRTQTEQWLEEKNINYDKLYMLNLPDAETRRKLKVYAKFKAEVYSYTKAEMFIESSAWQALEISRITGKTVFCMETMELLKPNYFTQKINLLHSKVYRNKMNYVVDKMN